MSFAWLCVFGALFGVGLGWCVQRSGFCIAHGMGEIFLGRGKRIVRLLLVVFVITAAGFLLSAPLYRALGQGEEMVARVGLRPIGQLRGLGLFNLLAGGLFGAGVMLAGGCVLGALRQIGEGNLAYLLVVAAFVPGMAAVVYGLNPLLAGVDRVDNPLLPELLGVEARWVTAAMVTAAVGGLLLVRGRRPRRRR